MKFEKGLILALDVRERERALSVAKSASEWIDAVKINYPLVLGAGPDIIKDLSKTIPIICDFKVADIPNTNRLIVAEAVERGASGVIVHGFVGKDSVEACVKAADGKDIYMVTEMSHPGGKEYTGAVGEELASRAKEFGVAGIIAPATRPERISHLKELIGGLKVLSPGVGAQGGSAVGAIEAGANAIIVGRSIYQAKDPGKAAYKLCPFKD